MSCALLAALWLVQGTVPVDIAGLSAEPVRTPRTSSVEFKLGTFTPRIDEEEGLTGTPYKDTFGDKSMLLFAVETERFFYQGIGTAGVGFSLGYAEIYSDARDAETGEVVDSEKTALKVLPLTLSALYKFDYAAFHYNVPLVPYAQLGLIYMPWWSNKGSGIESAEGGNGRGGRFGLGFTAGLSLMLDFLEPRLARDFDSDMGVNHSYLFAEYTLSQVNNFGSPGLELSSRYWMFGLALDY